MFCLLVSFPTQTLFPGWCANKSYIIATSDLWFFIHASNLLHSTPHPTPLQNPWMKSHKSEAAITFICTPTRKQCRLSPVMNTWTPATTANKQPASAGTLGEKGTLLVKCYLMSSDVSWHIRDKLWPTPKHGSISLYVHGNQKAR